MNTCSLSWSVVGGTSARSKAERDLIYTTLEGVFPRSATNGKAAGPIRNQRMLDEGKPDLVVAFPGGRGTADMVRRAKAAGVPVRLNRGT